MQYRKTTEKDLYYIIEMKNRVKQRIIDEGLKIWLNGYPNDEILTIDISNEWGRVVEIDNTIVAYAVFYPSYIEYQNKIDDIDNLYSFGRVMVDNNFTKKGVGSFLVENMILEAKKNNQRGLLITADEFNEKAVNLYKSKGFNKIGEKQFPYAYLSVYKLLF